MRKIFVLVLALILAMISSTVSFGDESDITVNVGPGYEVLDVTVEESFDADYGQIENVTITWAPVEPAVDTAAVAILGVSVVFLAAMAYLRRKYS